MRILVATDGSRGSAAALRFAANLAARDPQSEMIILTIGNSGPFPKGRSAGTAAAPIHQERISGAVLKDAARQLQSRGLSGRSRFQMLRTRQPVPDAIARFADRVNADLVVVGSEGRDTLSEWVVGGVALRLIYMARRPVTVVRPPRLRRTS